MREAWNNGISPNEFRKCLKRDLLDISELNMAFGDKAEKETAIKNMMQGMTGRF